MNISRYYQDSAALSLNGSIVSLGPAAFIIVGNLLFINRPELMVMAMPFFIYSFISFHFYLFRMRQSFTIGKTFVDRLENNSHSLFDDPYLLVLFQKTQSPELKFFFSNGLLAGTIRRARKTKFSLGKAYTLHYDDGTKMGFFTVKSNRVAVYDLVRNYIGYVEVRKNKKLLYDANEKLIYYIEGSTIFMDEKVVTNSQQVAARLRRGWMRVQWHELFPDPNTPVLSFREHLSEKDKLLIMGFLIHEFFIIR
jgi:hypothetical protein